MFLYSNPNSFLFIPSQTLHNLNWNLKFQSIEPSSYLSYDFNIPVSIQFSIWPGNRIPFPFPIFELPIMPE